MGTHGPALFPMTVNRLLHLSQPVPAALLSQVRQAARDGVGIDIMLRRCLAGNTEFVDSLIDSAEDRPAGELFQLLRVQNATFECLTVAVIDEHTRASESLTSA
ncbi:MAG TPA: hypothetical protein VNM89_02975 [Solirubrobacterales bacterium]|nr:hypothetical protein [Solirubrobacterales bacterium]